MMLLTVIRRFFLVNIVVWVLLTTTLPQFLAPTPKANLEWALPLSGQAPLSRTTVVYVIAHPDDEVMFFAPLLLEMAKPARDNDLRILCFSDGDADGLGPVRRQELKRLAAMLGVNDVTILDFVDGMNITWAADDVATALRKHVPRGATIVTFDDQGVLGHPNHISLYHGAVKFAKKQHALYVLKSLNFAEKYSFTVLTNLELFVSYITRVVNQIFRVNLNISFYPAKTSLMRYYADLNMVLAAYGAMMYGHYSQMVWFRYGWLFFSRYLTYNHLIKV